MEGEAQMGRYDTAEWDDEQEDEQGGRDESNPMRELRAADRAKAKRIKELEAELSGLKSASRERSVRDVLSARGLNPKISAFIPQDIDPTEEAVSKWVDEYGDVFGVPAPQESNSSEVGEEDRSALRGMDSVVNQQVPSGGDAKRAQIANASSREELDRVIFGSA